eukprot:3606629-Pyramimonas_sp.AAC.1
MRRLESDNLATARGISRPCAVAPSAAASTISRRPSLPTRLDIVAEHATTDARPLRGRRRRGAQRH